MAKRGLKIRIRALALVVLLGLNYSWGVRADETCYDCTELLGVKFCGILVYGAGHTYCEVHDDHCDYAGPCFIECCD